MVWERRRMMVIVKARFDGRVFVPQGPVSLPPGFELEIPIPPVSCSGKPQSTLAQLAELAAEFPADSDLPADLAAQHDHYLYGMPKRP
jgi:hypothetical protein